jgi:hypothetical protein
VVHDTPINSTPINSKHHIVCIFFCAGLLFPALVSCASAARRAYPGDTGERYLDAIPIVRGIRAFGGADERLPPIILRLRQDPVAAQQSADLNGLGAAFVTIEIDVQSIVQPQFAVRFVHCDAAWREDGNVIINDPSLRTTNLDITQASSFSRYFTHRARLTVPSADVQLRFSGNWKAMVYDFDRQFDPLAKPLAEVRFFVVEQETETALRMGIDAYSPRIAGTSPAAYSFEASLSAPPQYIDENFSTVTLYRAWRWNEPLTIMQNPNKSRTETLYNRSKTGVLGFSGGQKRFRISSVPAENEYRTLDLSNPTFAPASNVPVRFALADLRRNGVFRERADDAAMTTTNVPANSNEYVQVEFVLDPEFAPSSRDIYVVGSFNDWSVQTAWKMTYNSTDRLYTARGWMRRARHNYAYATAATNAQTGVIETVDYEECEGNSIGANHTFYALFYYQSPQNGGYDALLGVAAANAMRRR